MIPDFEVNTSSLIFSNITSSKAAMCVYSVALLCGLEITFLYFFDVCNFTVVTSRGHYRQLEKNRENVHRTQQSVK